MPLEIFPVRIATVAGASTWGPTNCVEDGHRIGTANAVLTGTSLKPGKEETTSTSAGWRWTNVTVPLGATITSATIALYGSNSFDHSSLKFKGVLEANTAAYTVTDCWSHRTPTDATVDWDPVANPGYNVIYASIPAITTIVAEIIGQVGWASGNALGIWLDDDGSDNYHLTGILAIESLETEATLTISYTT